MLIYFDDIGNRLDAVDSLTTRVAAVEAGSLIKLVTSDILTVTQALSQFPPSSQYRGMYVRVSDLFGYIDGIMRCGYDSQLKIYFWQPTTPEYGRSIPITADMTFAPLTSPTAIVLTGTVPLGTTRTLNLATANGRPGEIKEIRSSFTTLLGVVNLVLPGVTQAIGLPTSGYKKFMLDGSSGTLTWTQLI